MKSILNSEQYQLIYPLLQSLLAKQVKAVQSLGQFAESNPEIRRICPYDYYRGNVGFMRWLIWYLNPDKPLHQRPGRKKRGEYPTTTDGGADRVLP